MPGILVAAWIEKQMLAIDALNVNGLSGRQLSASWRLTMNSMSVSASVRRQSLANKNTKAIWPMAALHQNQLP